MKRYIKNKIRQHEKELLEMVVDQWPDGFHVVLSDGSSLWKEKKPDVVLRLNDPRFLLRTILFRDDYVFGRAFIDKKFEVEGDMIKACSLKDSFNHDKVDAKRFLRIVTSALCINFYHGLASLLKTRNRPAAAQER